MRHALLALVLLPLLVLGPPGTGAALAAPGAVDPAAPGWVWPVDGPRIIVRPYLAPATPYAAGHRGVDLGASGSGAEVVAVTSGIVHFAGVVVDRPVITVRQGQVLATVEPVTPLVAAGDRVEVGQVIGLLEPGHCARPCVHLGVRVAGEYVSPLLYLGGLQRAVLLPLD
ncbi:peptidoglycan DD-metalloendopeptidase family protein [Microcella humidisoli]|jgi:murein DD-endopeptidase MepM/ murein hydrolase activator NlpD|uniref:Peptidoglycan DD-metalloendopeptidase family protein n=1 Tax=Microcella humidisoli TaxID=2963406 RepID=A0ABY5FU34_9MICO|nr:peptidoglycan DD-metalloendopeptidase family protein [Microcella humidisoli]UTT61809.1 peptidoglycan DD-metalloendopeptidase family protein [Microcella humidisoli]